MASLPLVLAGGWAEAEAFAHALPELFPLFGRHVLAALGHSPPIIGAMKAATTNASEQNPAESQQSDSLPEGNLPPSEQRRQQPIPQVQYYFAADDDNEQHPQDRQRNNENQSLQFSTHVQLLTL